MQAQEALTPSEQNEIMAALGKLASTIKQAYADDDADLYISAFDPDAIVSLPGTPPVGGHDALRTVFENRPELPPGATFEVKPLEIDILSPEWAYAYGMDTIEYLHPGTGSRVKETMTFLVLIRKTDDGWKTFREVVSADQA
jgi:uncharacterized protein (TIGR02246 family)